MYDILKEIAETNNWRFTYARKDFQNLFNELEQDNVPHVFLDPVEIEDNENDSGIVESKTYSGDFMLVVSSDIDEVDYDTRYQNHIKPILETTVRVVKDSIRCDNDIEFNQWRTVEVINALDYNFDGIVVKYNLTVEV